MSSCKDHSALKDQEIRRIKLYWWAKSAQNAHFSRQHTDKHTWTCWTAGTRFQIIKDVDWGFSTAVSTHNAGVQAAIRAPASPHVKHCTGRSPAAERTSAAAAGSCVQNSVRLQRAKSEARKSCVAIARSSGSLGSRCSCKSAAACACMLAALCSAHTNGCMQTATSSCQSTSLSAFLPTPSVCRIKLVRVSGRGFEKPGQQTTSTHIDGDVNLPEPVRCTQQGRDCVSTVAAAATASAAAAAAASVCDVAACTD